MPVFGVGSFLGLEFSGFSMWNSVEQAIMAPGIPVSSLPSSVKCFNQEIYNIKCKCSNNPHSPHRTSS